MALGDSADTVEIPDTTPAGEGIPSFTSLFPILTQIDPTAGGVFIQRTWMNGLFQLLGNNIWYLQHGCLFPWNATFDYPVGAHVLGSDNNEYVAVQENTGQDPTADNNATYWIRSPSSPDGVTIANNSDNKIMAQDVAIGGDESDLASKRGLLGVLYRQADNVDVHQIFDQGQYIIRGSTASNVPNTSVSVLQAWTLEANVFAHLWLSASAQNRIFYEAYVNGTWSPWLQILTTDTIGDGITVNQGIISVPEYEGATASAAATSGLVPPAAAGQQGLYLSGGGEWDDPAAALRQSMIGMIATVASTNLPEGWMICDGSSVLFADWPEFEQVYNEGRFVGMTLSASDPSQVGKFVLNGSTGVYLPDLEGLFVQASASGTAGAYVAPAVPNIIGDNVNYYDTDTYAEPMGAFYNFNYEEVQRGGTANTGYSCLLKFDASRSSAIYSNSVDTVQPPAVRYVMAMYLGKPAAAA